MLAALFKKSNEMTNSNQESKSAAHEALLAVGDKAQAEEIALFEAATEGAQRKLKVTRESLVVRMIFGQQPELSELCSGADKMLKSSHADTDKILSKAITLNEEGLAFDQNKKISTQLRDDLAQIGVYGLTVPKEFSGLGLNYSQLACLEESLAANGLGSLAVEVSGQLTIGSSALLGYGTSEQRTRFLPEIAKGRLIAFALTEVGVGVNAKRVQAWVERDEENQCWRLNAYGAANKLYITSATHGGLAAIVARKGKGGKEMGLFILEMPEQDMDGDVQFSCESSNVSAFAENINSRISFKNFPVPFEQEIQGNGVEVLFY